ncbi:hypothetical protein ASF11_12160 [Acidovorax sp. Leaf76]|nr:hypothetical protein ASF11_12160 [Acidovorax sp. Leaf76]KQO38115.1 hypothetical protein ASF19_20285 [Acidovorax sp. Leaf84]KQS29311.1 hypothetical protein ASG27_13995 [Acidovorax sp. Leaf191]
MVPTLHIRGHGASHYQARIFRGQELIGEPSVHTSVEQAIAAHAAGAGLAGVTGFHLWYEGCTVGAVPLTQMRDQAHSLAQRLIVLTAVMR